jgi:hypothetical protein
VKKTVHHDDGTDVLTSGWIEKENMSGMMSGDRHRRGGLRQFTKPVDETINGLKDEGRSDCGGDTDRFPTNGLEETVKEIIDQEKSRFGLQKRCGYSRACSGDGSLCTSHPSHESRRLAGSLGM